MDVWVFPVDLSEPGAAKKLYAFTREQGLVIDQLVNNAGAGKSGRVVDTDPEVMDGLNRLNVLSVTELSHFYGKEMVERGHGRIMNVSSLGGYIADPYFNVYGPTKAYELFLTQAMYGELKGTGVTVSALCPGPTRTNWAKNAGKADSKTALSPEVVARYGYAGMQRGDLVIFPGRRFRLEKDLMGLLPADLQASLIARWPQRLIGEEG